ncbi:hypothetical protein PIB30_088155 [Stylosanthes scabra]|uniref:Uncharacterized protein n=1 Tax=Stylosanthes scabra TaxID=79078 RepID=A0ABU6RTX9_9FABA|nr:hypothetical protein [Stylosanthes scabra]
MRMVKMGPYLSAMLPKVTCGGSGPPKRWRCPISGHAPAASGGAFLAPCLVDRNGRAKRVKSSTTMVNKTGWERRFSKSMVTMVNLEIWLAWNAKVLENDH